MVWSKINSTGTRESAQANTAANGSCFSLVWFLKIARSCSKDVRFPAAKRLLPSSNSFNAISGVSVDCARAELEATNSINSIPVEVTNPATAPPTAIWRNFRREAPSFDKLGCEPQVEEEDSESGEVWLSWVASFFGSN